MKKFSLPTYEECLEICKSTDNFIFYETKTNVDGYDISMFNYRLVPSFEDQRSRELRGLTFVFNKDGSLFKRYLLLDKFFNMNQHPETMYSVVKDYKIKSIMNKEDGSVASFIKLPNGKVLGKSKMSIISEQALEITKIYNENPNIKRFVDWSFENDIVPVFEYVSPFNRVVLPYAETKLILLRLRDNNTGEYLDINDFSDKLDGISVANFEDENTLDELIEIAKIIDNKEGWVIQFSDGTLMKLKTKWYLELHSLFTEVVNRENELVPLILNDTIDDLIPQIDEEKRKWVLKIVDIVNEEIHKISNEVDKLVSNYKGDRKEFALTYIKDKNFPIAMSVIDGKDKIDEIKKLIGKQTMRLQDARKWISDREK